MLRKLCFVCLMSWVVSSLGCAVCFSPDDYTYGAYGGRWQRHDLSSGRVGSAYAEAGYDTMFELSDAETPDEPELLPGDDNLQPVSYEKDVASYIE